MSMLKNKNKVKTSDKKSSFSHPLVMMMLVALGLYIASFFIPSGSFQYENGVAISGSYEVIDKIYLNPWDLFLSLGATYKTFGNTIAILIGMSCYTQMIIKVGALNEIIDWASFRLREKSVKVLVPCMVVLMSLMGALAGNDGFAAFAAVGIIMANKLKLDKISAVAIFYLPMITGLAMGPTTVVILAAQEMVGVQPLTGAWIRILIWPIITAFTAFYVTRYCLKISKDPSKMIAPLDEATTMPDAEIKESSLSISAIISFILLFVPFVLYAVGSANWGWASSEYLFVLPILAAIFIGLVYRKTAGEICDVLCLGGKSMGSVFLMLPAALLILNILSMSKITDTIANFVTIAAGSVGGAFVAPVLFLFIGAFNLISTGGTSKLMWMLPLFQPITQALNISDQMLCLIYQFGDGLTNYMTPVSPVLMTALVLANVDLKKWLKFALPYCAVMTTFYTVIVFALQLWGNYI